jgi:hypothetical protein
MWGSYEQIKKQWIPKNKKGARNVMTVLVIISISGAPQSYLINGNCINPGV